MLSKFKTQPLKHQLDCLRRFGRSEYFALNGEQGTGKTWIAINDMADLWSTHDLDTVLVFAPNGVHSNWVVKEIPQHMPEWVRVRYAAWYSNPNKKEREALENVMKSTDSSELKIIVMNWESLQHKKGVDFATKFAANSRSLMIVADESQRVKEPSAARTKNLMKLKKYSKYRRTMSGTPITNGPFGAFSQYSFLDDSILGTTSYFAFKAEYAEMLSTDSYQMQGLMRKNGLRRAPQIVQRGVDGRPKYRNLDQLQKIIEPYTFRVLKKDCLDLPDKIYKCAWFDMTAEQKRVYEKVKEESRISLNGNDSVINHLTVLGKLCQITSGYYLHPDAEEPVRIEGDNPKMDLLCERVSNTVEDGHSVIIWARYRAQLRDIAERMRVIDKNCVEYHGGVSKQDRIEAIDKFQSGEAKIFIAQQQSGGTGITLTKASQVIYFSDTFSLEDRLQSEDRAHRIGQDKSVVYTNILARNTIDEVILNVLKTKQTVSDIVTGDALKKYFL
jgi:SNF2 family DNA or RNA helicase